MLRCKTCVMPNTRPDTPFIDGECAACVNFARRPSIDWDARKQALLDLLGRHQGRCIVPSSGGKDSTWQALTLKALGADVTVVTARTCHLTDLGRKNIDNLARYCETVEYVPNMAQRAKLNRLGLEMVGDISWPEHCAIFTVPFRAALELKRPIIFYGENPQDQYGGPLGTEDAQQMTLRWRSEFGGFLGLRPQDVEPMAGNMSYYVAPPADALAKAGVEAHFLGQYLPWDSNANFYAATDAGMKAELPCTANYWTGENLDCAMTGLHDHVMYRKYGYGRGATQISCDVRSGMQQREWALDWVREHDGLFPEVYMGVPVGEVLDRIGMSRGQLSEVLDRFTNCELFGGVQYGRPILR